MSTVIMVGDSPLIMSGTESTLIMVTNDRISPTTSVGITCGTTISTRMRSREAPRLRRLDGGAVERGHGARDEQRDERRLLPDEGDHDSAPVEEAGGLVDLQDAERDEGVVHQAVLGEERAHALRRDHERDE